MIKYIGIELEGAWDKRPPDYRRLIDDGSVTLDGDYHSGELPSPKFYSGKNTWKNWVKNNYPARVGPSCGLHVHMSFKEIGHYTIILENASKYQEILIGSLKEWGKKNNITNRSFWDRLNNKNYFCKHSVDPDNILIEKYDADDERHKAVNFCAFKKHGTLEIRVLSAFYRSEWAIKAIETIIDVTNKFLKRKLKKTNQFVLTIN